MKTFLLIITITIHTISAQNICDTICQNNDLCLKKCQDYYKDPNRNPISPPNCGLSKLDIDQTDYEFKPVKSDSTPNDQKPGWPWIVSLQYQNAQPSDNTLRPHFCTGVIIDDNFILSSAQCVPKDVGAYQVMIGSKSLSADDNSAQIFEIESVIVPGMISKSWVKKHEGFKQNSPKSDDILLIKTATKIEPKLNGNEFIVNAICLPGSNMNMEFDSDRPFGRALIAGWDYKGFEFTQNSSLIEVENPVISIDEANSILKETRHYFGNEGQYFVYNYSFTQKDLATMASVAPGTALSENYLFNGDRGSPLIKTLNGRVFMIGVSHWLSTGVNPISVWERTSYYTKWLEENMKKTIWQI